MYLLFDIGGSKTRMAFSVDGAVFEEPRVVATPSDFKVGMECIRKIGSEVAKGRHVQAVGGGVPGTLDREKKMLVRAPHLKAWAGKPLHSELEKIFSAPVLIENDAALAGLGEARSGAGREKSIVAYLTISTGVGGARIVQGEIDFNTFGFEPGHQIIDIGGEMCEGCRVGEKHMNIGHLEEYVSGAAVKRRFGQAPSEIINPAVWDELARFLSYGLHNTIVHWSPEIVVLGGAMILKKNGIKIERVREYVKEICTVFQELPDIKEAALGDFGGLHGALELISRR